MEGDIKTSKLVQDLIYITAAVAIILTIWIPEYESLYIIAFFNIFYTLFLFGVWHNKRKGLEWPSAEHFLIYTILWVGGFAVGIFSSISIVPSLLILPLVLILAIVIFSHRRKSVEL